MYELTKADLDWLQAIPKKVVDHKIFGMDDVVTACVIALLSGGHVLLEGNPGLGKTALVKAMTQALDLGEGAFGRIQFTPDLMPADITGTRVPMGGDFANMTFAPGPVFCQLLLADEINRATPKTQAAMLEAMAEYQVTVLGTRQKLRHWIGQPRLLTPFMVLATQNPIDQDGTYPLPEAQSDRFMFKLRLELPDSSVIDNIIAKELQAPNYADERPDLRPTTAVPQESAGHRALFRCMQGISAFDLPEAVRLHVVNIVQASNRRFDQVRRLAPRRHKALVDLVGDKVDYGLGPRAASALAKAALGWALMRLPGDMEPMAANAFAARGLAATLVPVLRHRLRLLPEALPGLGPREDALALETFLRELALASVPDDFAESFAATLATQASVRL